MSIFNEIQKVYSNNSSFIGASFIVVIVLFLGIAIFTGVVGTASIFVLNGLFHLGLEYNLYNYGVTAVAWLLVRKLFKQYKD